MSLNILTAKPAAVAAEDRAIGRQTHRTADLSFEVGLTAMALALVATAWAYSSGHLVAYHDSASHLYMARRILDNLTPGIGQIGTTWLPLPHLVLQPFIYIDFLYQTALAASLLGLFCFIITCVCSYRLFRLVTERESAALIGTAVIALNPNHLYLQATPLTEPVLLAAFSFAAYHMVKWAKTLSMWHLVLAGAGTFCAALSRYDGWALAIAGTVVAALVALRVRRDRAFVEASALTFGLLAGYAIVLWMGYQWLLYGDPLYSVRNPFSAQAQQEAIAAAGKLLTKRNLPLSISEFLAAVAYNVGPLTVIAGATGLLLYALKRWRTTEVYATLFVLCPVAFNIVALFVGQTVIRPHGNDPETLFNVRYGMMGLLPAAFGVALLVRHVRYVGLAMLALVLSQTAWLTMSEPVSLRDGLYGASGNGRDRDIRAASWLREHHDGGTILADPVASASLMYRTGLPLRTFIHDGNRVQWGQALDDLTRVDWLVFYLNDRIHTAFQQSSAARSEFQLVFKDNDVWIYRYAPTTDSAMPAVDAGAPDAPGAESGPA